ncbi:hypothetical protein D3C71_969090 [compost metagenome]
MGARGGDHREALLQQRADSLDDERLVGFLDRDEGAALGRQDGAAADLRLGEGAGEGGGQIGLAFTLPVQAHDLAGRTHFRAEDGVHAGEAGEGEDGFLDRDMLQFLVHQAEAGELLAGHDLGGDGGDRLADGLGHEGRRAAGARVHFQHEDARVFAVRLLDGELDVHQAAHLQGLGHGGGLTLQLGHDLGAQREGRHGAGAVARVDAGFLDVFQHAGDEDGLVVAQGVDVYLGGAVQIVVDQHRIVARDAHGLMDVAVQLLAVVDDHHAAAAQDVGGAQDDGIADFLGLLRGFLGRAGQAVGRLLQADGLQHLLEAFAVLGQVDAVDAGAQDRHAVLLQGVGQLQRGLAAELHHDADQVAFRALDVDQLQHVLARQGLEVEAVGGVVVGRDGLGVAVDHDRLDADVGEGEGRVAAAVVELDALADAVGTAAEDDGLLLVRRRGFALGDLAQGAGLIGRIHIGGGRGELGGAGVDALEHRAHAEGATGLAHGDLGRAGQVGQTGVGEALGLQLAELGLGRGQALDADVALGADQVGDLTQEPGLVEAGAVDFFHGQAVAEGLGDDADAVRRGLAQGADDGGAGARVVVGVGDALDLDLVKAVQAGFQTAQGLLHGFLEGAADGHDLADRLHGRGQVRLGTRILFKREARDLGDDIVDARLEAGRRHHGDVVLKLVQGVADGQTGGDLGDGEAGGLGRQGRGARHARVHLDHDHAAVGRVDRPLDVGAAGLDADLAQDVDRAGPHQLIFFVGQRQGRGDGDAVAGVDAHRVDVLDRADDDAVVRRVADDLHLVFLPAQHRLFDQDLGGRRQVETALHDLVELLDVVGDAAAGAGQGEAGADDGGQADEGQGVVGFFNVVDGARAGAFQTQLVHGVAELLTVLGLVDDLGLGADHLDAVLGQGARGVQGQGRVQRGLAAHGRQQGVGALLGDDLLDDVRGDRLDIGGVGHLRVGHDGGGVRVDQDDPVALGLQRLAGLNPGIVELTRLADDDRAGADDQDGLDVCALGHRLLLSSSRPRTPSRRNRAGRPRPRIASWPTQAKTTPRRPLWSSPERSCRPGPVSGTRRGGPPR